jgi:hypothetical protein
MHGASVPIGGTAATETIMTTTIQSARQFLCTSVAALVFATIAICTAVPVLPVA